MKKKQKEELHGKPVLELRQIVTDKRNELLNLRLERSQRKLKNTRLIFTVRKDIARIETIIKEKRIAA